MRRAVVLTSVSLPARRRETGRPGFTESIGAGPQFRISRHGTHAAQVPADWDSVAKVLGPAFASLEAVS